MSFSTLINEVSQVASVVRINESWSQGRASFGGVVAALVYESMTLQLSDDRPVRSLHVSFVGPVAVDEPLHLESEVLREGKSVSQILGRGVQNGQTQVSVLGSFGHGRPSTIHVNDKTHVFPENPSEQTPLNFFEGVTPNFTKYFDFRYCTALPFAGCDETVLRGFVRFKSSEEKIGIAQLLALIDAWPPAPLPMLKVLAPASSLNWTVEFIQPMPALAPDEYCQYEAEIVHASNGYGHTRAKIWNSKGELIAISQQTVTIFG